MCDLNWIQIANSLQGTNEYPGSSNNPKILKWADSIAAVSSRLNWIDDFYDKDSIPWCGLYVGYVMLQAGYGSQLPKNPLGAKEWLNFGEKTTPRQGAVMVFSREGGGHVGFYVSEDADYYHILGGNQSDTVNIAKIAKSRFVGARWPVGEDTVTEKLVKKFDGKITTNEA
jgi:uncharacterized protein (TIGR02594 family)